LLPTLPAQAQNTRSFVSGLGNDGNPCSLAAPCRTFQHAHDQTNAGGEIAVLDTAGYGTVTITKSISIVNPGGVEAGIAVPSGGTGITITGGAIVALRGLTLEGAATGAIGIQVNSSVSLTVRDCVIRDFSNTGISFVVNSSSPSKIFVSNTLASDSGGGIEIFNGGSGTTTGVLDHVEMENNSSTGLDVGGTQTMNVTVTDSVSANNGTAGILADATGGTGVTIMVRNSTIANNGVYGLDANGTGATIRVTRSTITGNATGWVNSSGGVVLSYADNNIDGNGSVNTEPPSPLTYH
jgi:hypothetical protein